MAYTIVDYIKIVQVIFSFLETLILRATRRDNRDKYIQKVGYFFDSWYARLKLSSKVISFF